jgi:AcrR family transcriptional regulator
VTVGAPSNATARRLVELTLALIERRGGLRDVNLREVARHAKCSHANVYNYFDSFADLLWATLDLAIARLIAHTEAAMRARPRSREVFRVFIESQIDFALEHPGIYRFIWLDTLSGVPPAYVAERIRYTPILFATTLRESLAPKASVDGSRLFAWRDLQTYLRARGRPARRRKPEFIGRLPRDRAGTQNHER